MSLRQTLKLSCRPGSSRWRNACLESSTSSPPWRNSRKHHGPGHHAKSGEIWQWAAPDLKSILQAGIDEVSAEVLVSSEGRVVVLGEAILQRHADMVGDPANERGRHAVLVGTSA